MSGRTTFPDVTLAEQRPLTTTQLPDTPDLQDSNHVQGGTATHFKDTVVILEKPQRSLHAGFFVSKARGIFFLVCALLVLTIFVIFTAFVTREFCTKEKTSGVSSSLKNSTPSVALAASKTEEPSRPALDHPFNGLRLPRSLIPSHYDLELKIDLKTSRFSGSCNITLHVNTSTRYVVFHRSQLEINESLVIVRSSTNHFWSVVKHNHVTANQFHVLELDRDLPAGLTFKVEVGRFTGTVRDDLKGLYKSSYKTPDGKIEHLVSSQLQSTDARQVFPCFDEPDFKATFTISIVHHKGYLAFSNMPVVGSVSLGSNWTRDNFNITPVMSTYILAFVIGRFKSRNASVVVPGGGKYEIKVWARPDAYAQTEHALDFAVKTFKFFTEYFGILDTVPKYDHVAVPDFSGGAMENWGLIIYRETALLYDPLVSSSSNKYMVTLIVAHEIAHIWFGNMATMRWWDDLWLNEGFASSLMYIAMDHVYPEWNVFAIQVVEDIFPVMVKDALVTSHSVSTEIRNPEEIQQFFDMISYNKGMAVLRMLRHFIGPDNFRKGLQLYVRRFMYKNADMAELWQAFTDAVKEQHVIGEIMDTWTRQMGYPMVSVEDRGGMFHLSQTRFLLHDNGSQHNISDSPYGYKWIIPFTYVTQTDPDTSQLTWLNMDSANIPKKSKGWLLGNYEYQGFYRVMYEKPMWAKLADQLLRDHTVFPEASRAGLIGDSFSFSRANLLDYDVTLNLTRYLKKDMSYVPWRAFLDSMEFLRGMIAAEGAYVHLEGYLRNLVAPVFDTVVVSAQGTLPERYLRRVILSIACEVGLEKAVKYAKSMFSNWMKFDNRLPADLSLPVYSVGVREGGVEEWEFVWNKSQTTTVASEREMMMEALAQTQKPFLLWRYINFIFVPEKIKLQDVRVVMAYFTKTLLARMVSLQFLQSHWDEMNEEFGDDGFVMREVIQEVTTYVNSEYELQNLERLFHDRPLKSASKATENALELIRANIDWKRLNYKKISDWLQNNLT
ncbi:aminopeptidase N-like [Littorina saxatilis]|uniref:Aminopeptidase n=1 Tax=Littorina saxatilis TaxID=31220 RepID=A0AAN9B0D7_9CAEN